MVLSKHLLSFGLFVTVLGQPAALSLAQEPTATPSPSPQEATAPATTDQSKPVHQ